MAFSSVGSLHSETDFSSSASWTTANTLTRDLTEGQLGVVWLATDPPLTNTDVYIHRHNSLTDSAGNHWLKAGERQSTNGCELSCWFVVAENTLSTSGTFTFGLVAAVTAKAMTGWVYDLDSLAVKVDDTIGSQWNAADAGSLTLSSLANVEHLFLRGGARENESTSFTITSNYTAFTAAATTGGSGDTDMGVYGEFRILTGTTDSSDPTTSAHDQCGLYVALSEVDDATSRPILLEQGQSATQSSTPATASFTPTANRRVVAFVWALDNVSATITAPSASGNGLTWNLEDTSSEQVAATAGADDHIGMWMFSARGSPSAGALTFTFSSTMESVGWVIYELSNSNSVVQTATNLSTTDPLTVTLGAFGSSSNCTIGAFLSVSGAGACSMRQDVGYTIVGGAQLNDTANETYDVNGMFGVWRPDNDTTVTTRDGSGLAAAFIGIAAEIEYQDETVVATVLDPLGAAGFFGL
jgi:hypothetical protein